MVFKVARHAAASVTARSFFAADMIDLTMF
jgi:hypothetical protein